MIKLFTFALLTALARGDSTVVVDCVLDLGGITYRVPSLRGAAITLTSRPTDVSAFVRANPQVVSIGETFRFDGLTRAYQPLEEFSVPDPVTFSRPGATDVLDLLVKSPGMDVVLPDELEQFENTVQRIVDFEFAVNPRAGEQYAYLTVEQSLVKSGTTQRQPGWQLDGFQGTERTPRDEVDHTYLVTDNLPEVFTSQRFYFRGFDYGLYNVFSELDRQARPEFEFRAKPYHINFFNAYTAHRSPIAERDQTRTFLRVTFSRARFDKLGSTRNPLLPYSWPPVEKTLRRGLAKYVPSVGPQVLPRTWSLDPIRGQRLGLVSLGGADARVAAHLAEILIAAGRTVEFVASVQPSQPFVGGKHLDEDLIHVDQTFTPLRPLAEVAFAERVPTYLVWTSRDLTGALGQLVETHGTDGLVMVDVGGAALAPLFGQEVPLIEHRIREAIDDLADGVAHRTLVVAAPGYGLPADGGGVLSTRVRRYTLSEADRRRVEVSANTWDQMAPAPRSHEVAAQVWRQAVAERFGPQVFPPLNPLDPLIDVKPEHRDLLIVPLDDLATSAVRPVR